MKDILDENGYLLKGDVVMNKLSNKSDWISEYCKVKRACMIVEKKTIELGKVTINIVDRTPSLFAINKMYDICNRRSGFYYSLLRDQRFKKPYMQNVWLKQLGLDNLKFQSTWNNIYKIKIKNMPIKKLAEFNYKLLSGTLPSGYFLSKWKDISEHCDLCKLKEDTRHMLYDCKNVTDIWNSVRNVLHVNLQYKHIVIGYYMEQNSVTKMINWICCLVAYSIFKANNYCKWNEISYAKYNVKQKVVKDLIFFLKVQEHCRNLFVKPTVIKKLIDCISS